ncbi:hypothetical protein GT354_46145, partial [Streptomyces sp. SID3343]|nr:hypothetical protein [Streptomyces sp. SID3343]
ASRPDCPDAALVAFHTTHPALVARVGRPCAALLSAVVGTPGHPEPVPVAARVAAAGLADESHAELVLTSLSPARSALATLAELPPSRALPDLIHRHLGADPDRWATLRVVLSRHRGTVAGLLEGIALGTETAPPAAVPPAPSKPYRYLLYAARPDDLRVLLPLLPDELLCELLGKGALPAPALGIALGTDEPRVWTAVARNPGLNAHELRRLVALDEPRVDAAVYRHRHATLSLRRAIASGTPRTPGRTEPVPFDAELRARLLTEDFDQRLASPLITSRDPDLVRLAFRTGLSDDARRFAFARIRETGGDAAVRRLLAHFDDSDRTRELSRTPSAVAFEDPDALARQFAEPRGRNATRRLMQTIVHEPYAYDLAHLVAVHHEIGYEPEPIEELLRHEDADGEAGRLLRLALINRLLGSDADTRNAEPADWLRSRPYRAGYAEWVNRTVAQGLLDPARLLDTAHPATAVLQGLGGLDRDTVLAPVQAHVATLVRTHLAGHVDASVIAANLLDSFTGTIAELFAVAAQAAGPRPDPAAVAREDALA